MLKDNPSILRSFTVLSQSMSLGLRTTSFFFLITQMFYRDPLNQISKGVVHEMTD